MSTVETLYADRRGFYPSRQLNIANIGEQVVLYVGDFDDLTIQVIDDGSVSNGSLVLAIQQSNDGCNCVDFASPLTQNTAGISSMLSVSSLGYVHVKVTTAGSSGNKRIIAKARRQRGEI